MTYDYNEWLKNPMEIFCKCGCNIKIIIKSTHKYKGIPEYINGHWRRNRFIIMHESYDKWLKNYCPKIYCICNCHNEIVIQKHHRWYGIPKYIHGHENVGKKQSQEHIKKRIGDQVGNNNTSKRPEVRDKISKSITNLGLWKGENNPMYNSHRCGIDNPNWQGGSSFDPYCEKFNEKKKEEIREQYGRKCYICEKDEKDNIYKNGKQIKLSVHHVDNDKGQGCDDKPWKLLPLCIHCHNKVRKHKIMEI